MAQARFNVAMLGITVGKKSQVEHPPPLVTLSHFQRAFRKPDRVLLIAQLAKAMPELCRHVRLIEVADPMGIATAVGLV